MSKIQTAEEWLNKHALECIEKNCADINELKCIMIHFAREHVEAALKEALDSIPCLGSSTDIPNYEDVEEAVLNAYPLENIK
jgi:hypothetical protein